MVLSWLLLPGLLGFGGELTAGGAPTHHALAPGTSLWWQLPDGSSGPQDLLAVTVEQLGVDVLLVWRDAGGAERRRGDGPFGRRGRETLVLPGYATGDRLELRAVERGAPAGEVRVELEVVAAESPRGAALIAASRAGEAYAAGGEGRGAKAWAAEREAQARWQALAEPQRVAASLAAQAVYGRLAGDLDGALAAATAASAAWQAVGGSREQAWCENERGFLLAAKGERDGARTAYERALGLWRAAGDGEGLGRTANNLGLLHLQLGAPQAARELLELALPALAAAGSPRLYAQALNTLAGAFDQLGESERAEELYQRALAAQRERGDFREAARVLANLANLRRTRGSYQQALDAYQEALALLPAATAPGERARVLSGYGELYLAVGEPEPAFALLTESLGLRRAAQDTRGEAYTLHNLAAAERARGHLEAARAGYEQALERFLALADRRGEAGARRALARVLAELGQPELAVAQLAAAITASDAAGDRRGRGEALRRWAALDLAAGLPALALARLAEAAELAAATHDGPGELDGEVSTVRALRALGREAEARVVVDSALARVERQRAELTAPELRATFLADRLAAFDLALALAVAAHDRDPTEGHDRRAFTLATRRRSRSLLDRLEASSVGRPAAPVAAAWQEAGEAVEVVQSWLPAGTLLLVYHVSEEGSWLFSLDPGGFGLTQLPARHELTALVTAALPGFDSPGYPRPASGPTTALAKPLLEPVAARLARAERWWVVADGPLERLPFAALAGGAAPPLTLLPAVALARGSGAFGAACGADLVVLADPVFDTQDPRAAGLPARPPSPFTRLPWSAAEARAVARAAGEGGFLASGFAATLAEVEGPRVAGARLLHFATHGVADPLFPERSGLALAGIDRAGAPAPGFLSLPAIQRLALRADLVVLSGCRTAAGRELAGEGTVGLSRAFLVAGARQVIATLWPVEDEATARLMDHFYAGLLGLGLAPDAALARAQRALREEARWAQPYYWAGFVLYGTPRPVR